MKKILVMLVMCLLLMGGTAIAAPMVYVCDINSGNTIGPSDTGVSLVGVLNIIAKNIIEEDYSIQLGGVSLSHTSTGVFDNANPGSYGKTVEAGATVTLRYGVSNTPLTTAGWEAKALTGTTLIVQQTIGSGSTTEPFEFAPEPASQLALFFYSGCSQYLLPIVYLFAR